MPKKRNPGAGRPPKPANSTKSKLIQIKVTPPVYVEIREAAAEARLTVGDFLVDRALHLTRLAAITAAADAAE
jgi:uncharacterized protein (DUF1778 family)